MSGRSARNKGAAAEREFGHILSEQLGFVVKRKLGQARDGGDDFEVQHFRIEVKRRETLCIKQWCHQIEAAAEPHQVPVVVFRQNGEPWRVVLTLDDFIPLMRNDLKTEPTDFDVEKFKRENL